MTSAPTTMIHVPKEHFEKLVEASQQAAAQGLMLCSSGNISYRLDDTHMLIKGSRSWMAKLTAEDIAVCRIDDGASLNGKKPSVEIGFHRGVLTKRQDVNVVLHFQSPFATTLCCREPHVMDYNITPEVPYYIGPIAWVPYHAPGSKHLALAVTEALAHHNMAMLANHGQVTVGRTYDEAIQRAVFFEMACGMIVRNGDMARRLPEEVIAKLHDQGVDRGYGV